MSSTVFALHLLASNIILSPSDFSSSCPPPHPPNLTWGGVGAVLFLPSPFISSSFSFHNQRQEAPLILLFVIQASIMHKLVNLAVQRGMTWNPAESAVSGYILDGDNGKLNACLGDCPVSHTHYCVTRPHNHTIKHI